MTQHRKSQLGLWALAAGVLLVGSITLSGQGVAAPEKIGKIQQGLVGGEEVDEKVQEQYGLLKFTIGSGTCSASLLRNDWAISAAHCVDAKDAAGNTMPDPKRPGQNAMRSLRGMRIIAAWGGSQTKRVTRVETFWPYDVALIQLDSPVTVNGRNTGYVREVFFDQFPYFGTPTTVTIKVFGAGINQFASGEGDSAIPSSSDDKFRMGTARVAREEGTLYWYPANGPTMIAGGDSGGPSFATVGTNQTTVLVGVHALTHAEYVPGKPTTGWDWVTRTPEAADAPIKPVWNKILEIMGPLPAQSTPPEPFTGRHKAVHEEGGFRPSNGKFEENILYGVRGDGDLIWHKHYIDTSPGRPLHSFAPINRVGNGWKGGYKGSYPAGQNAIYTLADNGDLQWRWHRGAWDGQPSWNPGVQVVAKGWNKYSNIIPMDNGVVYAIDYDGKLSWHKHTDYKSGAMGEQGWAQSKIVHKGFDKYYYAFAGGKGVLYALGIDGHLYWYRHKDYLDRAMPLPESLPAGLPPTLVATLTAQWPRSWEGPKKVGDGWIKYAKIFSPGDGHLYGVTAEGELQYHRHLGWETGEYRWDANVDGTIAEGWNGYAYAWARTTTSDEFEGPK